MKKLIPVILLFFCISQCGCQKNVNTNSNTGTATHIQNNLDIMVTNKSLYLMVCDIAGNNNSVEYMFKDENKIKDFSFTADSISSIGTQDLLFYSGAGFENWIDNFVGNVDKSKIGIINVSRGISLSSYGNKNDSSYGSKNPYYWLDADNYKVMLLNIKNAIEEKDPDNITIYETNFTNSIKKIDKYKKYAETLNAKLKKCTFVTDEDKFDYLLKGINCSYIKFYHDPQGLVSNDDESKVAKSKDNGDKLCFIYDDDNDLQKNADIIAKYKMVPIKVTAYNGDMSYLDIIKSNVSNIENAIK